MGGRKHRNGLCPVLHTDDDLLDRASRVDLYARFPVDQPTAPRDRCSGRDERCGRGLLALWTALGCPSQPRCDPGLLASAPRSSGRPRGLRRGPGGWRHRGRLSGPSGLGPCGRSVGDRLGSRPLRSRMEHAGSKWHRGVGVHPVHWHHDRHAQPPPDGSLYSTRCCRRRGDHGVVGRAVHRGGLQSGSRARPRTPERRLWFRQRLPDSADHRRHAGRGTVGTIRPSSADGFDLPRRPVSLDDAMRALQSHRQRGCRDWSHEVRIGHDFDQGRSGERECFGDGLVKLMACCHSTAMCSTDAGILGKIGIVQ